jgi:DNA polymerase (family 10)
MKRSEVSAIFAAMADILAIQDASYHRIMAYRRAAENIAALGQPLDELSRGGQLGSIPGIGKTLASKIDEYLRTGRIEAYERLKREVPAGVVAMLQIPGVGAKRVALFWKTLGVTTIEELAVAARDGRVAALPGMGVKSQAKLLDGIERLGRRTDRSLLGTAWPLADEMLGVLRTIPGVVEAVVAGSVRRRRETVGDVDLLVAASGSGTGVDSVGETVMDAFCRLPPVGEVLLRGNTKSSVRTGDGLQVDLRVLEPARWGTALQYFTGSQAHNIRLRAIARTRDLSLSEYSLRAADGSESLCATEADVYRALGLSYIPPELREDRGEIEAARAGSLPQLIGLQDLLGDLHIHTTWSDGHSSPLDMARAAKSQGLSYALVADHTWSLGIVKGVTAEQVREQRLEINEANRLLGGPFRILAGAEVEIRADGSLDLPDEVLAELDIVVASMHTGLRQPREKVTSRTVAAIRNPHVDIIAHPTGRLIGEREAADLDMEAVFRVAAETGTALEVNSWPRRLDLDSAHVRRALEIGVKLAIGSDAHDENAFADLIYGVATARRGWATRRDVINSWPLERLLEWVDRPGAP